MEGPGFLVIQTAFIGDVILATSLLENLHCSFPGARLDILVRKGNEGLFEGHPYLRKVLVWDKKKAKYKGLWHLFRLLRQEGYDYVINVQRYGATGFLTAFSGAKHRIGFDKNPFSFLFTSSIPHRFGEGRHETARNHQLIKAFTGPDVFRPRLYPSQDDYQAVAQWQEVPYICIAPASVWFTKQFPAAQWIRLIRSLPTGCRIFLVGAPGDKLLADSILREAGRADLVNLCGELTLLQSAAFMEKAVLCYVNDSAPMHLCSAVNAPVCAIYCSTVPEFGYGPLSDHAFIMQHEEKLKCRPCGIHGRKSCPEGHFECAYGISTQFLAGLASR